MKLPTLYSKRENGGLQEWTIEILEPAYSTGAAGFRTIAGKVDGKLQVSEWTYCQGKNLGKKNATNDRTQAITEAQAKWDKKVELGEREKPGDLGNDGIFWPMLAKEFKLYADKLIYPIICQPKLNGIRVVTHSRGTWSRRGKKMMSIPHIDKAEALIIKVFPELTLDGEGYSNDLKNNFEKICSLIRKTKPTTNDLKESEKKIFHYVYDCQFKNKPELTFLERFKILQKITAGCSCIRLVPTYIAKNKEELDKYYKEFRDAGYEGQIVRQNLPYANRRCTALLKRKEFMDAEFRITQILEGKGGRVGTAGAILFKNKEGKPFHATPAFTFKYCKQLWKDKKILIGKIATVKFFCYTTKDKVPYLPNVIAIRDYE